MFLLSLKINYKANILENICNFPKDIVIFDLHSDKMSCNICTDKITEVCLTPGDQPRQI